MVNRELVNRLIDTLDNVLPVSQVTDEIKVNIKESITSVLHDMDVVTREEFEAQQRVLGKTREKIDQLEAKLTQYNLNE